MSINKHLKAPRVQRWGNSLAVRLPAALLASSGIKEGTQLEITNSGNGLLIKPIQTQQKPRYFNPYSEQDLLKGLSPDSVYTDIVFEPSLKELGYD